MNAVSLLIKPASSLCPMRCRYCFYDDLSQARAVKSCGVMTRDTARSLVRAAFDAAGAGGSVSFAFQGGEPTLAGLDFFRGFVALEREYAPQGVRIAHSIQTGGLAIDGEWAEFFRRERFLVGLSLDGGKDQHDLCRVDADGKGTWSRVVRALAVLQKKEVDVNLLCVVTAQCARRAQSTYSALKKLGGRYLQFIPCLDPLGEARGKRPYSLTPQAYGNFLRELFDLWYADWRRGEYVSIRLFDDYVHLLLGLPPSSCSGAGACGRSLVVEGDGGLYPCDFYVLDEWRLGCVDTCTLPQATGCGTYRRFHAQGRSRPAECRDCPWQGLCRGGCPRDYFTASDGAVHNYYCPAFRAFFPYAAPRLSEIARAERAALEMQR